MHAYVRACWGKWRGGGAKAAYSVHRPQLLKTNEDSSNIIEPGSFCYHRNELQLGRTGSITLDRLPVLVTSSFYSRQSPKPREAREVTDG